MKRDAVDLFCGCGGLSRGLMDGGFNVVAGFDGWADAIKVYEANFSHDHPGMIQDLGDEDTTVERLRAYEPFLVAGGPPCQDFSSAGKRKEGDRADLTVKYANIVTRVGAPAFIMENVSRAQHSAAFNESIAVFRRAGYGLTLRVMNASLCGVPQLRKRLFLIGMLGEPDDFLAASIDAHVAGQPMTVRQYDPELVGFDHYYRHPRTYERRAIYSIDEPSPTIRGVNRPKPGTYNRHSNDTCDPANEGVKSLSLEQRARIQTFPEGWFDTKVPKASKEQMVGNAVPVQLAKFIADRLMEYVETVWADRMSYEEAQFVVEQRDRLLKYVVPNMREDADSFLANHIVRTIIGGDEHPDAMKSTVMAFSAQQARTRAEAEIDGDEETTGPDVEEIHDLDVAG